MGEGKSEKRESGNEMLAAKEYRAAEPQPKGLA
jgi:hypothetical protein